MSDTALIWLNIGISSGTLLFISSILMKISHKLARIEQLLGRRAESSMEANEEQGIQSSSGSAFESFLEGDAIRRNLPKNEQFAAYRQWRKENGMTWSK